MSTKYVAGFMFDLRFEVVALVEKSRPAWQQGLHNGIGGHVEFGESPVSSMVREFKEETGMLTSDKEWTHYARLIGDNDGGWEVDWFWSFRHEPLLRELKAPGDEPIHVVPISSVSSGIVRTIANLPWLLDMALTNAAGFDRCKFHIIKEQLAAPDFR